MNDDDLLNIDEIAAHLKISRPAAYHYVKKFRLNRSLDSRIRVRRGDLVRAVLPPPPPPRPAPPPPMNGRERMREHFEKIRQRREAAELAKCH